MKKIVSLAIACMLLLSCFAINAFAATEFTFTASAPDADGVFGVTFNSPVELKKVGFTLTYDTTKLVLLNADRTEAVYDSAVANNYFTVDILGLHDLDKSKIFNGYFSIDVSATSNDGLTPAGDMVTVYFKLVEGAKIEANPFTIAGTDVYSKGYGGINCTGASTSASYRVSKNTATGTIDWEALKAKSDFGASAAGTTITCFGKVPATVSNYGVVFTKESTVEGARDQKYYGAMPGDTVALDAEAGTTQIFTFGAWDGTFEIILEGVHTGDKVLNFFMNDQIIPEANTFTVNVQ